MKKDEKWRRFLLFAYYMINKFNRYTFSSSYWECSRLCIFFSALAAILIAIAIAAAVVSIMSRSKMTTGKMHDLLFEKENNLEFAGLSLKSFWCVD
jgi:hypothetical protein